jgi:LysR family transcriptional regulator, glycine cleavage system transcriptional activator
MTRRVLPPLRGLRAFEAVARLGSFHAAAGELNVTRSAVSHQIRAIEQAVGVALFERDTRPARLTPAGVAYHQAVRDAFDRIEQSTRALAPARGDDELVIQVYVTVALKWLIPRLYDFERRHPEMRVRLSTSYVEWDFDRDNADVGFILARRKMAGLHYTPLFRAMLAPVCSPRLLPPGRKTLAPRDLRGLTLLHVYTAEEDWRIWLEAAGVEGLSPSERIAFDSYVLAQQAADEGQGVAMTLGPFAKDELRSGRLVKPFALTVPHAHCWELVCAHEDRERPKIDRFAHWLVEQVRADREIEPHS